MKKQIITGAAAVVKGKHTVSSKFRFFNCDLEVLTTEKEIILTLPGNRDATSELLALLPCFSNLSSIDLRERFCVEYSSLPGSNSDANEFYYPNQWEEFFDSLNKYELTNLTNLDFSSKYFLNLECYFEEGYNFALLQSYSRAHPSIKVSRTQ